MEGDYNNLLFRGLCKNRFKTEGKSLWLAWLFGIGYLGRFVISIAFRESATSAHLEILLLDVCVVRTVHSVVELTDGEVWVVFAGVG